MPKKLINNSLDNRYNKKAFFKDFQPDFSDGILLKHNQKVYDKVINGFSHGNKVLIEQATGTGKSYIALKTIIDHAKGKRVLFVSPSDAIDTAFVDNIIEHLIDKDIDTSTMTKNAKLKLIKGRLNIEFDSCLYQGLGKQTENKYDLIIFDEVHRMGAKKWGENSGKLINNNPQAIVLGMTATLERPDHVDVTKYFDNKKPVSKITLVQAIRKGILPCPKYHVGQINFEEDEQFADTNIQDFKEKLKTAEGEEKNQILEFLDDLKKAKRMIPKSNEIPKILKEGLSDEHLKSGKFIVFCPTGNEEDEETEESILKMHKIMDQSKSWFKELGVKKVNNYSVYSKQGSKLNRNIIKNFENDKKKGIKLLFSINMLNEGLHVKDIDGVIMLRSTGSRIVYLQELGRGLSASDDEKDQPIVFDLVSNLRYVDVESIQKLASDVNGNDGFGGDGYGGDGDDDDGDDEDTKKLRNFKVTVHNLKKLQFIDELKKRIFVYKNDWFTPFYNWLVSLNGDYKGITTHPIFGGTVTNIRLAYKGKGKTKLTDDMIKELNAIGFPWGNDWFTPFYDWLVSLNGNYKGITTHPIFGQIVVQIRLSYKGKGGRKLTDYMIKELNAINFPWEAEINDWFTPFYNWLVSLKGNYKGITTHPIFGHTVSDIRLAYKGKGKTKLTQEMIDKLNAIGFPWTGKVQKTEEIIEETISQD